MTADPLAMPVITPVVALTFILVVSLLFHVPPDGDELNCLVLVTHTLLPPVMVVTVGIALTVNKTDAVLLQAKPLVTV